MMIKETFNINPFVEKSNYIKNTFRQEGFEEFFNIIDIIEQKASSEKQVLMGELLPLLLIEISEISEEEERKILHAWYCLYAATIFLDDLADRTTSVEPREIVEASCLVNLAHIKLHDLVGDQPIYKDILSDLQKSLAGELTDVVKKSSLKVDRSISDLDKNSVLFVLCRLIENSSSIELNLIDFCQTLIPCIQGLDDLGDLHMDIKEKNYTTLVQLIAGDTQAVLEYSNLVYIGVKSGSFIKYIQGIKTQLYAANNLLSDSALITGKRPNILIFIRQIITNLSVAESSFSELQHYPENNHSKQHIVNEFEQIIPLIAQSS